MLTLDDADELVCRYENRRRYDFSNAPRQGSCHTAQLCCDNYCLINRLRVARQKLTSVHYEPWDFMNRAAPTFSRLSWDPSCLESKPCLQLKAPVVCGFGKEAAAASGLIGSAKQR